MKRSLISALSILLVGGSSLAFAQVSAPTGPSGPAAVGDGKPETSDRTPQKKTPTPLSQRDKTSAEPSGMAGEAGSTSDRTPSNHDAAAGGGKGADPGKMMDESKGETTSGTRPPPN
jgi:hypothetical protein